MCPQLGDIEKNTFKVLILKFCQNCVYRENYASYAFYSNIKVARQNTQCPKITQAGIPKIEGIMLSNHLKAFS